MRPHRVIAVVLVSIVACAVVAQAVEVSIRYQDKQIYVPGSEVLIKVTIQNDRSTTYRFRVAENRLFNLDFDVRTLSNLPLEPAPHRIIHQRRLILLDTFTRRHCSRRQSSQVQSSIMTPNWFGA